MPQTKVRRSCFETVGELPTNTMKNINAVGLVLLLSVSLPGSGNASGFTIPYQTGWLGPQLNVHFGHDEVEYSIGLEASYWRRLKLSDQQGLLGVTQLGVDVGVEYNLSKEKWVHYAELQTGIILGGTSFGVVFDEDYGVGWQWSSWVNWVAGGMVRFRWFTEVEAGDEWSLGGYVKAPYLFEDELFTGEW